MATILIEPPTASEPSVYRLSVDGKVLRAFTVRNKNSMAAILRAAARVAERVEYDAWIHQVRER